MRMDPKAGFGSTATTQLSSEDVSHFDAIAAIAHRRAGLVLSRDKAPMVLARLGKRMRSLGIESLKTYREHVERSESEDERRELIYCLTTNVTSFMRESHHFDTLSRSILPTLSAKAKSGRRVRLWSAGCSSGQEPYSIAMMVLKHIPDAHQLDIRILATDIDTWVLERAKKAHYSELECNSLPTDLRNRFILPIREDRVPSSTHMVRDEVRALVTFRELNLVEPWPMKGKFDVIFCRNVIIYFDRVTQGELWKRFDEKLEDEGILFLGHSERIDTAEFPQFKPCGTTTYQRLGHLADTSERT